MEAQTFLTRHARRKLTTPPSHQRRTGIVAAGIPFHLLGAVILVFGMLGGHINALGWVAVVLDAAAGEVAVLAISRRTPRPLTGRGLCVAHSIGY